MVLPEHYITCCVTRMTLQALNVRFHSETPPPYHVTGIRKWGFLFLFFIIRIPLFRIYDTVYYTLYVPLKRPQSQSYLIYTVGTVRVQV